MNRRYAHHDRHWLLKGLRKKGRRDKAGHYAYSGPPLCFSQPPAVGTSREADVKHRLFVKVWRWLPLSVTEVLGPQLPKRMPFG